LVTEEFDKIGKQAQSGVLDGGISICINPFTNPVCNIQEDSDLQVTLLNLLYQAEIKLRIQTLGAKHYTETDVSFCFWVFHITVNLL
jgi:hypothetical protein